MENSNLLLSETDFIEAWENFLHCYSQANKLLALTKSSTPDDKASLYIDAVEAHKRALEAFARINQLVLRCVETPKQHLDASSHKS